MPNFQGQLTEEQVMALISYIKAMGPEAGGRNAVQPGNHRGQLWTGTGDCGAWKQLNFGKQTGFTMIAKVRILETPNYLTVDRGVLSWLLTTDHKRIALLYTASITFFFLVGGHLRPPDAPGIADARQLIW